MTYILELTEDDMEVISFVGNRYSWSQALCRMEAGEHDLTESEAWNLVAQFEEDGEGNHGLFPMLDRSCDLYGKLTEFMEDID